MINEHRDKCLAKVVTQYKDFVRLKVTRSPSCVVRLTASGTAKSVNNIFSGLEGFDIEVVDNDINKLEILLLSPFGEYAKLHEASVNFYESASGKYREQVVIIDPAIENRVVFNGVKRGDRVEIVSISSCVIPFEIDASRFADRRDMCVGVESIIINGEGIQTEDLLGS
jgi:hypothetical protein